jgi:N-acetylglutamate synthase-like GNAT family acetyltransferase
MEDREQDLRERAQGTPIGGAGPLPARHVRIRRATVADAASLATLLGELGYPTAEGQVPGRLRRLAADPRAVAFVAEREGRIVGVATIHMFDGLHADDSLAQLTLLVVGAGERGAGIGRRLVEAVEGVARAGGCHRIFVTTAEYRAGAHAFYQRLGYEYTGRRFARKLEAAR